MVSKLTWMKSAILLKTEKSSWKGRVYKWMPYLAYNKIGAESWQGRRNHQGERNFDKPIGNKSSGPWII